MDERDSDYYGIWEAGAALELNGGLNLRAQSELTLYNDQRIRAAIRDLGPA